MEKLSLDALRGKFESAQRTARGTETKLSNAQSGHNNALRELREAGDALKKAMEAQIALVAKS